MRPSFPRQSSATDACPDEDYASVGGVMQVTVPAVQSLEPLSEVAQTPREPSVGAVEEALPRSPCEAMNRPESASEVGVVSSPPAKLPHAPLTFSQSTDAIYSKLASTRKAVTWRRGTQTRLSAAKITKLVKKIKAFRIQCQRLQKKKREMQAELSTLRRKVKSTEAVMKTTNFPALLVCGIGSESLVSFV